MVAEVAEVSFFYELGECYLLQRSRYLLLVGRLGGLGAWRLGAIWGGVL